MHELRFCHSRGIAAPSNGGEGIHLSRVSDLDEAGDGSPPLVWDQVRDRGTSGLSCRGCALRAHDYGVSCRIADGVHKVIFLFLSPVYLMLLLSTFSFFLVLILKLVGLICGSVLGPVLLKLYGS